MLLLIISMAVIYLDFFAEYFNNLPYTPLPSHRRYYFRTVHKASLWALIFFKLEHYFVRAQRIKDCLKQPNASLVCFVLLFFKWFIIVFSSHCNSFQTRPHMVQNMPHHACLWFRFIFNRVTAYINVLVLWITTATTVIASRVAVNKSGIQHVRDPANVYLCPLSATNVI